MKLKLACIAVLQLKHVAASHHRDAIDKLNSTIL